LCPHPKVDDHGLATPNDDHIGKIAVSLDAKGNGHSHTMRKAEVALLRIETVL
jgi:hypothetical protein